VSKGIAVINDIGGIIATQGEVVRLEGIYIQNDVRMKMENPKVLHSGHVAILMSDGTKVYLYPPTHELATRETKEIKALENKKVYVDCMALPYIPMDSSEQQVCIESAPCIVKLNAISINLSK
jgi:hypothetical protein